MFYLEDPTQTWELINSHLTSEEIEKYSEKAKEVYKSLMEEYPDVNRPSEDTFIRGFLRQKVSDKSNGNLTQQTGLEDH